MKLGEDIVQGTIISGKSSPNMMAMATFPDGVEREVPGLARPGDQFKAGGTLVIRLRHMSESPLDPCWSTSAYIYIYIYIGPDSPASFDRSHGR